jgi:hypothetical protein
MTRCSTTAAFAAALLMPAHLAAQQPAPFTELAPGALLFATAAGNVVAVVTAEGAFLVGPLSVASTGPIQAEISRRTRSAVRYVVAVPRLIAQGEGDGGWGRLGAMVATHEDAWSRLADPARLASSGAAAPVAAFSEVLKFDLGGHGIHIVHQHAGFSDADFLVHFETDGLVYLGESLPGDGYPMIDAEQHGTLEGLIQTLGPWTRNGARFVPARGPVLAAADIMAFRDMLLTVSDRVRALAQQGQSADQVVAAHPSAEFDARFGHGRVGAETFVREVFRAVSVR